MKSALLRFLSGASERRRYVTSAVWAQEARLRGARLLGPVLFLGKPILTVASDSAFIFEGDNLVLSDPRCNEIGNAHPCILRTLFPGATLRFGHRVGLSSAIVCAATSIIIGEGTLLGAGAMVLDNDFHKPDGRFGWKSTGPEDARPVRIGRGCFLGARSMVLKGVTLGDRVVVGAGAVVTKDVPEGKTVVGNPARVVGEV